MKRRILMVLSVILILFGLFILVKLVALTLSPKGRGALQVSTNIKAQVTLNGKSIGASPLCLCEPNQTINSGIYDLKITPEDKTFEAYAAKININSGVLTAVERTFLPGALASSYVLTLEKTDSADPQIFIVTVPDNALVSIDGDSKGATPFTQPLSESEHEVEITKVGFSKKTIRVRAVKNYKLILDIILGAQTPDTTESPTVALSPIPTAAASPTQTPKNTIVILNTPTGFLRVRDSASVGGKEIGRVLPGERYQFIDENDSWYEIQFKDGSTGWISKSYAQKVNQ